MALFNFFKKKKKEQVKEPAVKKPIFTPEIEKAVEKEEIKIKDRTIVEQTIEKAEPKIDTTVEKPKTVKPKDTETKEKAYKRGLTKTRLSFMQKLSRVITAKSKVDDSILDSLEEALITSDVGVETSLLIIERLEKRVGKDKYINNDELKEYLKEEILEILNAGKEPTKGFDVTKKDGKPFVILVVGVNGVGKTTTIGKLANKFKQDGLNVALAAGDTFRAAAVDQLKVWAERSDTHFVSKGMNVDPSAVAFDACKYALENKIDVLLIDTAGRLQNKKNLMQELGKINRVIGKAIPNAPHEVVLVLDASTGQNALEQAKQFADVTDLTSLILTKIDGTAKGGVVLGVSGRHKFPVKYVGVGEKMEDLREFDAESFAGSLFGF